MNGLARGIFLGLALALQIGAAQPARAFLAEVEPARDAGVTPRRSAVLDAALARPVVSPDCAAAREGNNACIWGQATLAMTLLARGGDAARANALLREAATTLPRRAGWKRREDPMDAEGSARTRAGQDFYFVSATLMFQAMGLFGQGQPSTSQPLTAETRNAIRALFWDWASTECRLADADVALIWRPWGSENHDIQRIHACWAAAELLRADPATANRAYADRSTPTTQLAAWNAYLKAFLTSRAGAGLSIEFFSPTYAKYFLGPLYSVLDFASDTELRGMAESAVTLWWAMWAQEQVNGHHGGSRTRNYPPTVEPGLPMDAMVWLYFGIGQRARGAAHPAHMAMLLSRWRPPATVVEIATGTARRAPFEVWTRHPGFSAGGVVAERTQVQPNTGAVSRYAYVTPDFVMGSAIGPRLPVAQWAPISSQNRWSGVTLTDGTQVHASAQQAQRSNYNALVAAQLRGTQIVARVMPPMSRNTGDLAIVFERPLRPQERGGWLFVEGSAHVAARAAFGGHGAGQEGRYTVADQRAPVIIVAAPRAAYPNHAAFQAAVLAAPLRVTREMVEFEGIDGGGRLRFFLDGEKVAEANGRALLPPAEFTLHSPFLQQARGATAAELRTPQSRLSIAFDRRR
jgi:hypothetical protein